MNYSFVCNKRGKSRQRPHNQVNCGISVVETSLSNAKFKKKKTQHHVLKLKLKKYTYFKNLDFLSLHFQF